MRRHIVIVTLMVGALVLAVLAWSTIRDAKAITAGTKSSPREKDMQTKITEWTSERGVEKVETVRLAGESIDKWCARHDEAVTAAQKAHPPI